MTDVGRTDKWDYHARNNGRTNLVCDGDCVRGLVTRGESEEGTEKAPTRIEAV
jgi:hypothetical protein